MNEDFKVTWLRCGAKDERSLLAGPGRVCGDKLTAYWFHWFYQGKCSCRVKGKKYELGPDDVILLQPGHIPRWEADPIEPAAAHYFGFNVAELPAEWPPCQRWPIVQRLPADDIIRPLFEYMVGCGPEYASAGEIPSAFGAVVEVMVTAFVRGPMERLHTFPRVYPDPVQRVLYWIQDFMRSDPSRKVTLDDLAQVSGVCRTQICRLFAHHIGHSPMETLYIYRLTRSLVSLSTGKKAESIALDLGFASAAHYTQRFQSMFGKSPIQMRNAMAKGYKPKLPHLPSMG